MLVSGVEMLGAETGACVEVEEGEWIVLSLVFWLLSTDNEDVDVEFSDCNITDVGDPSVGEQASHFIEYTYTPGSKSISKIVCVKIAASLIFWDNFLIIFFSMFSPNFPIMCISINASINLEPVKLGDWYDKFDLPSYT